MPCVWHSHPNPWLAFSFGSETGINVAVKLALCGALLFTYVLMMFPVFEVLENNWLIRLLHWGSAEHVEVVAAEHTLIDS